jgi:outer membrane lipoprotein-sorting protein
MNVSQAAITLAVALSVARADSLDDVLRRMDAAAPKFTSMTATLKRVDYHARFPETEEKTGSVRMQRTKNSGPAAIWKFEGKDPETFYLHGHTGLQYLPKVKMAREYEAGKHVAAVQEALLLGFGARSADLQKTYDIALGGTEKVAGKNTTWIRLTPKSKDVKDLYTRIDLWVEDGESNPTQEKIWTGTKGDYILATYSDLKINPDLPDSEFKFTPPPGTLTVKAN